MSQSKPEGDGASLEARVSFDEELRPGTARYEVLRCLGRGGHGVVHEAFDRLRGRRIALKALSLATPSSLYQFKQEFRALAEVRHGNLVRLYELFTPVDGAAYFTMELIEGQDFRRHTRAVSTRQEVQPTQTALTSPDLELVAPANHDARPRPAPSRTSPAKLDALRPAMAQLVAGMRALHSAGRLHRDIKPSNVMVASDGRVVVLDFGLSAGILHRESDERAIAGTPEYMAPEQVENEPLLPAADWYSVGALLFDALVGHPPFRGDPANVLAQKLVATTIRPSQFVVGVPGDLDELCERLLARDPRDRPTGKEVEIALQRGAGTRGAAVSRSLAPPGIVSRTAELEVLVDALSSAARGGPEMVLLHGASGVGKSTLISQLVQRAISDQRALVFQWRVYEQEAIPFKALDGLLDQLSQQLRKVEHTGSSLPAGPSRRALGQLFPVLRGLAEFEPPEPSFLADPLETRRLAAEGLLSVLRGLARDAPLLIVMDDAQWGDLDSANLLIDVLSRARALPLLLIAVHRESGTERSQFLSSLRQGLPALPRRDLPLGNLGAGAVREVLVGALGDESDVSDELVTSVLHHSAGNAFLVQELAHTLRPGQALTVPRDGRAIGSGAALDGLLLTQRLEGVDPAARRLLEVVSVSGKALSTEMAAAAADVTSGVDALVSSLSQRRLLRTAHDGRLELLEVRHDRIREWVVARLSAEERRAHHRRLAKMLEALPGTAPDVWLEHWLSSGEPDELRRAGLTAARRATERLALKSAESLYRTVLARGQPDAAAAREIYIALAQVLEWDGRGAEAATAYLRAAELTTGIEKSALQSTAGMLLIYSGSFSEGVERLRASLIGLGLPAPTSALGALTRLIVDRLRLARVETTLGQKVCATSTEEQRVRVDVLHAAAFGFVFTDPLLGECFQATHVLAAHEHGTPSQRARALALEASQRAHRPRRRGQVAAELLFQRAERLAAGANDADLVEFTQACRGVAEFLVGSWRRAHELLRGAYRDVLRHRAGWHASAWTYDVLALCNMGRFDEVAARLGELIPAADARGDRFSSSTLRASANAPLLLARDDPRAARAELEESLSVWPSSRFLVQHWRVMWWSTETALYEGAGTEARARASRDERRLEKSFLLRVQYIRAMTSFLRARCALATFDEDPRARSQEILAWHHRLALEGKSWTGALAAMVLAGEALARRARELAARRLAEAVTALQQADMMAHAQACRLVLGELLGGSEGEELRRSSVAALAASGVKAPPRFAASLLPYDGSLRRSVTKSR